jgi:hypothetical protein
MNGRSRSAGPRPATPSFLDDSGRPCPVPGGDPDTSENSVDRRHVIGRTGKDDPELTSARDAHCDAAFPSSLYALVT